MAQCSMPGSTYVQVVKGRPFRSFGIRCRHIEDSAQVNDALEASMLRGADVDIFIALNPGARLSSLPR